MAVGCGGGSGTFDTHIENRITIEHGVYGQAVSVDNQGGLGDPLPQGALKGLRLGLFASDPLLVTPSPPPMATTITDVAGFYQFAVDGAFAICRMARQPGVPAFCLMSETMGGLHRIDFRIDPSEQQF
jgi:hypothetical protein